MFRKRSLSLVGLALALAACAPLAQQADLPTLIPTRPPPTDTVVVPTATATVAPPSETPAPPTPTSVVAPSTPEGPAVATAKVSGPGIPHLAAGQAITVTALSMLDASSGWSVAESAADPDDHILMTADGGQTWRDLTPPQPPDPALPQGQGAVLFALDARTAWVTYYDRTAGPLTQQPFVWRTTDAGQTWQASQALQATDAEMFSTSDLFFVDAQTGWLMAHVGAGMSHDYVMVYATHDGGVAWERIVDPFQDTLAGGLAQSCAKTGLTLVDAQTGWVTGDCFGVVPGAPYLYKTVDGGKSWQSVELPAPASAPQAFATDTSACGIQAPAFTHGPALVLIVTCLDYTNSQSQVFVYTTADGGNWASNPVAGAYQAAQFLDLNTGFVLTGDMSGEGPRDLYATTDGGKTLTKVKSVNWSGHFSWVSGMEGWAVATSAEGQALVHTTDGGKTWKVVQPKSA